MALALSEQW